MKVFESIVKEGRLPVALLLSLALLQIAFYYFSAAVVNGPGSLAAPQLDTLLYCQAARRIAEGHAFSFSTGTLPSTGTTSVLYPFVLAIPYALGLKAGALITAGFWINALFYLVFIWGWSKAFDRLLNPPEALWASLLLVLFPQTAYTAFAQSDMGLWMAVSAVFAYALATDRKRLLACALVLAPWVRPEGVVLILAFGCVMAARRNRSGLILAGWGAASVVSVMMLNYALTGSFSFSSVANKGHFALLPFAEAVRATVRDALDMLRSLVLAQSSTVSRAYYAIPAVGGLVVLIGMSARELWRKMPCVVFVLAALGEGAVVAQSGWQGTNVDRYLAWIMPVAILFSAVGWCRCADKLDNAVKRPWILAAPVLYSLFASVYFVSTFHLCSATTDRHVRFAQEVDRILPANASIGSVGGCGAAYWLGDRRMANLSGVYSPEFPAQNLCEALEILKNDKDLRFDYWLIQDADDFSPDFLSTQGPVTLVGPEDAVVRRTDWRALDRAAAPPVVSNQTLRCRIDVGHGADERRADYEIIPSYGMIPFEAFGKLGDLNGERAYDCGRLVLGQDEMTVTGLDKGRDLTVVLRTCDTVEVTGRNSFGGQFARKARFAGTMGVHLLVNGREVSCAHAHIEKAGFSDVRFHLSGKYVTASSIRLGIHGDHPAFGYWFYQ